MWLQLCEAGLRVARLRQRGTPVLPAQPPELVLSCSGRPVPSLVTGPSAWCPSTRHTPLGQEGRGEAEQLKGDHRRPRRAILGVVQPQQLLGACTHGAMSQRRSAAWLGLTADPPGPRLRTRGACGRPLGARRPLADPRVPCVQPSGLNIAPVGGTWIPSPTVQGEWPLLPCLSSPARHLAPKKSVDVRVLCIRHRKGLTQGRFCWSIQKSVNKRSCLRC
jgi:hypothetical protein